MTLAVVGLGQMGLPVAAALARAGRDVMAFDVARERLALAAEHGVRVVDRAVASSAPLVLTLLPDDARLHAFCTGAGGLLQSLPAGGVHLCVGTLGVDLARELAFAHAQAGQCFVACPVFGRPEEAWACDLTAVFGAGPGGSPAALAQARAAIACVAPRLHEAPTPDAACAVKLAGNQMIASAITTLAECFALVAHYGVAPALLHDVVTGKLFKGPVYEGVGRVLAGAAPPPPVPGFTLRLGLKDLDLRRQAAAAVGCAMPVADAARACIAQAVAAGHADRDWSELAGLAPAPIPSPATTG